MHKKLEFWGVVGTAIYLIVIASTVAFKFSDFVALDLNELGDFLAGAFGPIAFLWLVLGFLQQGRELKLSSEALQLQAKELKNSVEQQTIMAQAALQQIESQRAVLRLQELEVERSLSPNISAESGIKHGSNRPGVKIITFVSFLNSGSEARSLKVSFSPPIGEVCIEEFGRLRGGDKTRQVRFDFICPDEDSSGDCLIEYIRLDGKRISESFTYLIESENPFVQIERRMPSGHD